MSGAATVVTDRRRHLNDNIRLGDVELPKRARGVSRPDLGSPLGDAGAGGASLPNDSAVV